MALDGFYMVENLSAIDFQYEIAFLKLCIQQLSGEDLFPVAPVCIILILFLACLLVRYVVSAVRR